MSVPSSFLCAPPRLVCSFLLACSAAMSCVSTPEPAARLSNVATRHAPIGNSAPPATSSKPSPVNPQQAHDPAHAFDPPALLRLPNNLRPGEHVPLLLVLHGFGVSSSTLIAKAGLNDIADQKRFAYLAPEGARDTLNRPFWNAGKSCCFLDHPLDQQPLDDVKRLRELLEVNLGNAAIDPKRVFVIGYSNGGFMAQRLACDVGDSIAGVVSVAGAAPNANVPCAQRTALAVLEIHGDADPIVHYGGGTVFDRTDVDVHASALDTSKYWAQRLACSRADQGPRTVATIDLEPYVADRETSVQRFDDCRGAVELWTVKGGGHYVALQPPAIEAIWGFVQAHPKGGS